MYCPGTGLSSHRPGVHPEIQLYLTRGPNTKPVKHPGLPLSSSIVSIQGDICNDYLLVLKKHLIDRLVQGSWKETSLNFFSSHQRRFFSSKNKR